MKITWYGHSCFKIETDAGSVILDPFQDGTVPGYAPLRLCADLVLCSHEHSDHNGRSCVEISGEPCAVKVDKIETWHDDARGAKRGKNTIHSLSAEDMRLIHLGDLGCALTEKQVETLKDADALLIPIGGYYTIDTEQALAIAEQLRPRVVIPMHYRDARHGFPVISTADAFRDACYHPVEYAGNTFELSRETEPQTAFLTI